MFYEVVTAQGEVLAVFEDCDTASDFWVDNADAYDIRTVEHLKYTLDEGFQERAAVVFWWRQDDVHHGWYGNKEFATLAEARAQYETWTAEGKLANYVAL